MVDVLRSAAVFGEVSVFVWSDNVGVLAPGHRAGEIAELVRAAFAAHGAGPFNLRDPISKPVTEEFEFLGVNYRLAARSIPCAFIARAKVNAWELSIGSRIMTGSLKELDDVFEHIRRKRAVWGWWAGWSAVEQRVQKNALNAEAAIVARYNLVRAAAVAQ